MKRKCFLIGLFFLLYSQTQVLHAQSWTPDLSIDRKIVDKIQVSPDGSKTLVTYTNWLNPSQLEKRCAVIENRSQKILMTTPADQKCEEAAWSPDGEWISLLFDTPRLKVLYITKSEIYDPIEVGKFPEVSDFQWSPNGKKIAFLRHFSNGPEVLEKSKDVFVVGSVKSYSSLMTIDIDTASKKVFISGPFTPETISVMSFEGMGRTYAWSPDNTHIVFTYVPTGNKNGYKEFQIATVNVQTGHIQYLKDIGIAFDPIYTLDGTSLAYVTGEQAKVGDRFEANDLVLNKRSVCLSDLKGSEVRCLADTPNMSPKIMGWNQKGSALTVQDLDKTKTGLYFLSLNEKKCTQIPTPPMDIMFWPATNTSNTFLGFLGENFYTPPEVYVTPLDDFKPLQITHFYKDLPNLPQIKAKIHSWTSFDGRKMEGILVTPPGYKEGQRVPLVVALHGGPVQRWDQRFMGFSRGIPLSIALLASQGFAFFAPNFRGSDGYGLEFRQLNYKDWGPGPFQDVMTGVDSLIKEGIADPERLALWGWSYGGYLTAWTITQTTRFKAAIVGAGITDLISDIGTAPVTTILQSYFGGEYWKDYQTILRDSPIMHVEKVQTPTLIQHGELDQTVLPSQAQEFFHALKARKIPLKLQLYKSDHAFNMPASLAGMEDLLDWLHTYIDLTPHVSRKKSFTK